uniref:Uncharacterized protein n=1 Tax=Oryza nivara TaxID=4536 RepID=A0A0E0IXH4_ORYNI
MGGSGRCDGDAAPARSPSYTEAKQKHRARAGATAEGAVVAQAVALPSDAEWLERLPEKKKPLYTHNLPCIEAWLRSIGFTQAREDRAVWVAEMPLWHARLSLNVTATGAGEGKRLRRSDVAGGRSTRHVVQEARRPLAIA